MLSMVCYHMTFIERKKDFTMEKLKKLLCALLVSAIAVSVVSCGKSSDYDDDDNDSSRKTGLTDEQKEEKEEVSDEDSVKATVEGFMDAFCDFDFEEAVNYLDAEDALDSLSFRNKKEFVEKMCEIMSANSGLDAYKDDFNKCMSKVFDKIVDSFEYDITKVKVDGKKATAEISLSFIDASTLDFEDAVSSTVDEVSAMMQELQDQGKSQEEILEVVMPKYFDLIADAMIKAMDDVESTSVSDKLNLVKDGKDWVIAEGDKVMKELSKGFSKGLESEGF